MPFEKQVLPASPQCPTQYTIDFYLRDELVRQERVEGNYHRFRRHAVPLVCCDSMRITLEKTQLPGEIAGIYRIAVYTPEVSIG